jgi:SAM-dependent methyltransferase
MGDEYRAVRAAFGAAAGAYTTSAGHADAEALARVVAVAEAHGTDVALDIATGAGHTALALAAVVARVVAFDITAEMLAETERNAALRGLTNVTVSLGAAEALPFGEGEFDIVTVRTAPHHFADIRRAVGEMARVVKRGGRVVVVDTTVPEDDALDREINEIEVLRDPTHVRNYRVSEWRAMLEGAGLVVRHESVDRVTERGGRMDFETWLERIGTAPEAREILRGKFRGASPALVEALDIAVEGERIGFALEKVMFGAVKP